MISDPVIVLTTPRSRSAWLAAWLSSDYLHRGCAHDGLATVKSVSSLRSLIEQNDLVETAGSLFYRTLHHHAPNARFAIITRRREEIAESLNCLGLDGAAVAQMAHDAMERAFDYLLPRVAVVRYDFAQLDDEATLAKLWTYLKPNSRFYARRTRELARMRITKIHPFAGTPPAALIAEERRLRSQE